MQPSCCEYRLAREESIERWYVRVVGQWGAAGERVEISLARVVQ